MFKTSSSYPHCRVLEERHQAIADEVPPFDASKVTLQRHHDVWYDTPKGKEFFEKLEANTEWIYGWSKDWYNFPLMIKDTVVGSAERQCPKTIEALRAVGGINTAGFALLAPHATLGVHTDSTGPKTQSMSFNMLLSGGPAELYVTYGTDFMKHTHVKGEAVFFNSEHPHYATNSGASNRVILYVDVADRPT